MFHACGGPYPYLDSWQKFFSDKGIASIQVDSAGPRGMTRRTAIRTVCTGVDLQGQERAGDVYSVLANLDQFSWIDNDNLFLAGWSHGAYTLMDFMTMTNKLVPSNIIDFEEKNIPKIKGKITFYPHCGILNLSQKHDWRTKTPSLVFLADQDGFGLATQPSDCIDLFETMNKKERYIDFYLMENSTHVFDSEFYIRRGIVYNKESTDFAKNKIISFIKSSGSKDN
jgi:dienelactone hydrolase